VRLQRLDSGDRLSEVVLVPPAAEEEMSDPAVDQAAPVDAAADA
jgi:DNA gyrase subunit A